MPKVIYVQHHVRGGINMVIEVMKNTGKQQILLRTGNVPVRIWIRCSINKSRNRLAVSNMVSNKAVELELN
jgi:hypothetical protein